MEKLKPFLGSLIIALTVLISVLILSNAYQNRNRADDLINVTGLGTKDFTSDLIVWSGGFTRRNMELAAAFESLKNDREVVQKYLIDKGVKEKDVVFSSVTINKDFDYTSDKDGNRNSTFSGYRLEQTVGIESKEVELIENISREITELINLGVELSSSSPEYYYTQLAELKIEMIAAATEDARIRAEKIAQNANASLGPLRYAQMGIFQIIGQNSSEDFFLGRLLQYDFEDEDCDDYHEAPIWNQIITCFGDNIEIQANPLFFSPHPKIKNLEIPIHAERLRSFRAAKV